RLIRHASASQAPPSVPPVPLVTSDYSSQAPGNESGNGLLRRPSTSSEASQLIPSDKSSLPPSQTKSEDEEEEGVAEEDAGDEGDDEGEGGATVVVASPPTHSIPSTWARSSGRSSVGNTRRVRAFRADMSRTAVGSWLRASGFGSLRSKFAKFSGADMLRLGRRDLVLLCGAVEGIRLSNAIMQKPPRPICTIFVRKESESIFHAIYLYQQTEAELRIRLLSYLKLNHSTHNVVIVMKTPHNFDVAITDEVVSYFDDQSCFTVHAQEPDAEKKVTVSIKKM
uniref:SAM_3 domain-containing protein n=1 Tax=Mesocestoides corti TaxID=53468 RepID=A0A5K3FVG4_MESCO